MTYLNKAAACGAVLMSLVIAEGARADEMPEILVPGSALAGVHGLAVTEDGQILAGSVIGNVLWQVNPQSGAAQVLVGGPEGQADDVVIGPDGAPVWTSFLQGVIRSRDAEGGLKVLAEGLSGINSLAFSRDGTRLFASQVFLGDALWEIDLTGASAPRQIAAGMGGFNGFEAGADGWLYGPLWFKGQVARINPDSGAIEVVAEGFETPAAVNFDADGQLWVVDTHSGDLVQIDPQSGARGTVVSLQTSLDNLAMAADGMIYVSTMADNAIDAVDPKTGSVTRIIGGALAAPGGIALAEGRLWVADSFAFRAVDPQSGEVTDIARMHADRLEYPFNVSASGGKLLATSWFTSTVQIFDPASGESVDLIHDVMTPSDAVMRAGAILVTELATGKITRIDAEDHSSRSTFTEGLLGPVDLLETADGGLYASEAGGRILRVGEDGSLTTVADGLALPEGMAELPDGRIAVAEVAARRLIALDPASGAVEVLASDLPIGAPPSPGLPPSNLPTGVAVDAGGMVYFSSDLENAIYRLAVPN